MTDLIRPTPPTVWNPGPKRPLALDGGFASAPRLTMGKYCHDINGSAGSDQTLNLKNTIGRDAGFPRICIGNGNAMVYVPDDVLGQGPPSSLNDHGMTTRASSADSLWEYERPYNEIFSLYGWHPVAADRSGPSGLDLGDGGSRHALASVLEGSDDDSGSPDETAITAPKYGISRTASVGRYSPDRVPDSDTVVTVSVARPASPAGAKKRRVRRSKVWQHFEALVFRAGVATAKCRICHDELVYHNSTTSLDKHLIVKHRVDVKSATGEGGQVAQPRSNADDVSQRSERLHASVQKFIIQSDQMLGIVDDKSFQNVFADFDQTYTMLDSPALISRLQNDFAKERASLKLRLRSIAHVSLTAEVWTSNAGHRFVDASVHFLDGPKHVTRLLSTTLISWPHSAQATWAALGEIVENFGLSGRVVSITSGTAFEALSETAHAQTFFAADSSIIFDSLWHVLRRTVESAIAKVEVVTVLLAKVRAWAAYFETHPNEQRALQCAQEKLKRDYFTPQGDTPANLGSTISMLELWDYLLDGFGAYIYELNSRSADPKNTEAKAALDKVASFRFQDSDRALAQGVIKLLKPFRQALDAISEGANCPISNTLPTVADLVQKLGEMQGQLGHAPLSDFHTQLSVLGQHRFCNRQGDVHLKVAAALDPMQCVHYTDASAIEWIEARLTNARAAPQVAALFGNSNVRMLISHDEYGAFRQGLSAAKKAPAAFWHENRTLFPQLYAIASRIFVMQANSVRSPGLVADDCFRLKRASLRTEFVDMVMFLRSAYGTS